MLNPAHHLRLNSPRAGVTLFEALVVLSILALVLGVVATTLRGPSPAMQLEQRAAQLVEAAARARARAVNEATTVTVQASGCEAEPALLRFFSDGTSLGPDVCLSLDERTRTLRISPLTGRLQVLRDP